MARPLPALVSLAALSLATGLLTAAPAHAATGTITGLAGKCLDVAGPGRPSGPGDGRHGGPGVAGTCEASQPGYAVCTDTTARPEGPACHDQ
ncbi:hypothetical protein [Streptomyces sp. NPDC093248]|uniref:hypothetical protein n=1 Tax=Streptomyces sp. NPDC093248 TaxID=3155072 RepID=UPI00343D7154